MTGSAHAQSALDAISFVVNSVEDRRFRLLERNLREALAPHRPDIVRVPDAQSMAEGLNRGARVARGDWLIFCHDDIQIVNCNAASVLIHAMARTDMFGPCGTTRLVSGNWYDAGRPYTFGQVVARDIERPGKYELQLFGLSEYGLQIGAQALDGLWIACRRSLFDALRGFDATIYDRFVGYDIDISFRGALAGARVGICCDLTLFHDSHVGEFSAEKLENWERAQRGFETNFHRYFASESGIRGHDTIPLEQPKDALEVLALRRQAMSSESTSPSLALESRRTRWWPWHRGTIG